MGAAVAADLAHLIKAPTPLPSRHNAILVKYSPPTVLYYITRFWSFQDAYTANQDPTGSQIPLCTIISQVRFAGPVPTRVLVTGRLRRTPCPWTVNVACRHQITAPSVGPYPAAVRTPLPSPGRSSLQTPSRWVIKLGRWLASAEAWWLHRWPPRAAHCPPLRLSPCTTCHCAPVRFAARG